MSFELYQRVVVTESLPEEGIWAGDVGTVVHYYPTGDEEPAGYEVEFFSASGETAAVVSLPETVLRVPSRQDRLAVRLGAS